MLYGFFFEAQQQGGLLTHSDVAILLNVSTGTIGKQLKDYMGREGTVVPTRGIIHDIGRAITHKQIIIRYFLKGYLTPEIAKLCNHTVDVSKHCLKKYALMEISRTLRVPTTFV